MKHLMTFALAAAALLSVQAAESEFRSDINCVKTQNPLEIKSDNMKTRAISGRVNFIGNPSCCYVKCIIYNRSGKNQ